MPLGKHIPVARVANNSTTPVLTADEQWARILEMWPTLTAAERQVVLNLVESFHREKQPKQPPIVASVINRKGEVAVERQRKPRKRA